MILLHFSNRKRKNPSRSSSSIDAASIICAAVLIYPAANSYVRFFNLGAASFNRLRNSWSLKSYLASVALDYVFIVLPTLLIFTVLAEWVYICMIGLLFLLIFFTAVKRTYSLPYMEGPNASRASISSYRVVTIFSGNLLIFFVTYLCILAVAVDFRIYPREYAKTETYVTSLAIERAILVDQPLLAVRAVAWQVLLAVRALVLPPTEDIETWRKFASLCRKNGRISQARSTLIKLLQYDPEASPENVRYHGPPQVMLAYLKYQWSLGDDHKRKEAFARLQNLVREFSISLNIQSIASTASTSGTNANVPLLARVYHKLGAWQWSLSPGLDDDSIQAFRNATQCATKWAKAWHAWALFNTAVMSHYTLRGFPTIASQILTLLIDRYVERISRRMNTFIQDGKEMASVLYTYHSCVKALPQGACWNSQFGIQKLAAETGAASIYCGFWF
ncbi:hypothetical protein GOBAR_AA00436 [Gossypium barbadense]|uniref:PIK-related kinase FAT domain-containing protein n=1 Tax=Gossypium barbadense TaxID=3634 RepID=A0A2P5YX26_GOSBA|nr:hypothetical protein GOBAR_AA00436 [Gossypium barbadense]